MSMSKGNILIYRLGSLGDSIIALPAFHAIRRAFPTARITLLTNRPVATKAPPVESVLGKGFFFDEVLDYPVGTRSPFVLLRLLGALRMRSLDIVFNLAEFRSETSTRRDRAFFRMAGARRLYGFELHSQDQTPQHQDSSGDVEWEAARIARRVEPVAHVELENAAFWDLRLSEKELLDAERLLSEIPKSQRLLALSIGTKVQSKQWGLEKWTELSRKLSLHLPGWTAIFFGSPEEKQESEVCSKAWLGPSLNFCGVSSPRVSAAILNRCKLFIGHDSGPMHLAACVGTPCVAVFSARNLPRQWFPRGDFNHILYHKTDCAGCGLEECITQNKKCLSAISVDDVENAVLSAIHNGK